MIPVLLCSVFSILSSIKIILMWKRGLIALLKLPWWHMTFSAMFLFLIEPWVCQQRVIVAFPGHTYFLILHANDF